VNLLTLRAFCPKLCSSKKKINKKIGGREPSFIFSAIICIIGKAFGKKLLHKSVLEEPMQEKRELCADYSKNVAFMDG
jgi:hypothetical protein